MRLLKLTIAMSSPVCQQRTPSVSNIVSPYLTGSPSTRSGNGWRRYTGSCERGLLVLAEGENEPCAPCMPEREDSVAHAGNETFTMPLPAAISSATHFATVCQPAACQISNGPWFQP